jgi:aconitate hydratase
MPWCCASICKSALKPPEKPTVRVRVEPGSNDCEFVADVRIDTPAEAEYYRHGGILRYVLRQLLSR